MQNVPAWGYAADTICLPARLAQTLAHQHEKEEQGLDLNSPTLWDNTEAGPAT